MSNGYVVVSDTHHHNFSAFSRMAAWRAHADWRCHHINSRHVDILNAMVEVISFCKKNNIDRLYHGGDMFHVRGQVAPSVMNPVHDVYRALDIGGVNVSIIAGNHDLESRESSSTMNASAVFRDLGVTVVDDKAECTGPVYMVPWRSKVEDLQAELEEISSGLSDTSTDIIIHAPLNGIIKGIPDLGLDPQWLADLNFRNVLVGHFHDHKQAAQGVYSIGALTHQTWSDVNTAAGFVHVREDGTVEHHVTGAPKFVDAQPGDTSNSDGNYIRIRVEVDKSTDVEGIRQEQIDAGALGVVVHPIKTHAAVTRTGVVQTLGTLNETVSSYVKDHLGGGAALEKMCADILAETETV